MFILRFIGRILSIGLILFIAFILGGKHAGADATSASLTSAFHCGMPPSVEVSDGDRGARRRS